MINNRPIPASNTLPELQRVVNRLCDLIADVKPPETKPSKLDGLSTGNSQSYQSQSVSSKSTFHLELTPEGEGVAYDLDGNAILTSVKIDEVVI